MFQDVVIASAVRTPIGSFGGSLKDISAIDLGAAVVKEATARAGMDPQQIEEVVMGCVGQYDLNPFLARMVGLKAGCSVESTGQTVNRLCASGLQAVITAALAIDHGDVEICAAGGTENMSRYPYSSETMRWGGRMGDTVMTDTLTTALSEPWRGLQGERVHIAVTAENIAEKYGISREEVDAYAAAGQEKAGKALAENIFAGEIVPVEIKNKRETILFEKDEYPRATTAEKLSKLRPFAKRDGIVTAGNASGINDGAAALILTSGARAKEMGIKPMARVVDYAAAGVEPEYMGMGPVEATRKLLEKTGIGLEEIGLVELNEAFAAQAVACIRELNLNPEIVNVNGSGISLGHPIGATGAVISVKLLHEMERRNVRYGLATLCIGGGQGLSVLYEREEQPV